jgi:hypothetical protein
MIMTLFLLTFTIYGVDSVTGITVPASLLPNLRGR